MGDLNGNANPEDVTHVDDRNFVGDLNFNIPNIEFKEGETIIVPFKLNQTGILGYQFTLKFDTDLLEFENLISGFSNENDFGFNFIDEGILTTSWTGNRKVEEDAFTLVFKSKIEGQLNNSIEINSELTSAEGYSNDLEFLNVQLKFNSNFESKNEFILLPNRPNPFSDKTLINFYLPENSEVVVDVYNSTGSSIYSIRNYFEKGFQGFEIGKENLTSEGVYFYKIRVGKQIKIGKMILMD